MKFANPKNDIAFKKIFGDENKTEILISFLNAVLDLNGEKEITHITILNPYQAPKLQDLKFTTLDVRATDKRGINFIVEMQVKRLPGLKKRFVYYVSQAYSSQIKRGEDYPKLNQVFFIGVLDYKEFSNKHYLSRHQLLNMETKKHEIKELEFNFIELPKFTKKENELKTTLEKWVYFIKHAGDLEVIPKNTDNKALKTAYQTANTFTWNKDELELYNYWSMKDQDERGARELAITEAVTKAKVKAHAEGQKQTAIESATKMLADGLAIETIAKYTPLSIEEIEALKNH